MNSKLLKLKNKILGKEDTVEELLLKVNKLLKLKQGEKGDKGRTPKKGVDYFTDNEVKEIERRITPRKSIDYFTQDEVSNFKEDITPIKGKDYFTQDEVEEFKESVTPKKSIDYFTEREIEEFKKAVTPKKNIDYFDGEKGEKGDDADENVISERATDVIVKKFSEAKEKLIEDLNIKLTKKEKELLKKLELKLTQMVQRLQVHGGGLSREEILSMISGTSGGNFRRTNLTSQCDGVNKVFTMDDNYTSGTVVIWYSSFPFIYTPDDFTETGANQITFNAGTPAPRAGQSLMGVYEKS